MGDEQNIEDEGELISGVNFGNPLHLKAAGEIKCSG